MAESGAPAGAACLYKAPTVLGQISHILVVEFCLELRRSPCALYNRFEA